MEHDSVWERWLRGMALLGLFVFIFTFALEVSLANQPENAKTKRAAKAAFVEGKKLFRSDSYEEALRMFKKSHATWANPNVLFNIAMCHKALFQFVASIEAFERFLLDSGAKIKPRHRAKVESELRELSELVGRLTLVEAPLEAAVFIDGIRIGTTPLKDPIMVDPGEHLLLVEKNGFESYSTAFNATSGATRSLIVQLVEHPAEPDGLEVESSATTVATDRDDQRRPLTVAGISVAALGVASLAVGTVFAVRHFKDGDGYLETMDQTNGVDPAAFNEASDSYNRNRMGMIIGLCGAGALMTAGIIMVVVDKKRSQTDRQKSLTIRPRVGGISVLF